MASITKQILIVLIIFVIVGLFIGGVLRFLKKYISKRFFNSYESDRIINLPTSSNIYHNTSNNFIGMPSAPSFVIENESRYGFVKLLIFF